MNTIEGNLLDQSPGILCHQVNLHGIMGGGIAFQIKDKWPSVFEDYRGYCKEAILGNVRISVVHPDALFVAHMFGQLPYSGGSLTVTHYGSYPAMLDKIKFVANLEELPIYIPYGIGCGIAGGDWNKMLPILEEHVPGAVLVRYSGKEKERE